MKRNGADGEGLAVAGIPDGHGYKVKAVGLAHAITPIP
jgi:hypothetical protein